ncbi:restriction endonuclease [Sphingobium sp. BYY-5]|uniref:restriction endonuclease n=1 Tax=Sphingobium sp. BYY-5 TaxID=2926400 RepID=UPI001FA706D9|nr:restriction endonuclease [Sphingobium sp. BYY-5]
MAIGSTSPATTVSNVLLRDQVILGRLEALKTKIIEWATRNELWLDSAFKTPFLHRGDAPFLGEGLLLVSDGDLVSIFNSEHYETDRLEEEFRALLQQEGYWYELQNRTSALIIPEDEEFKADLLQVYRWQWIQRLSERRLYSLHSEVFEFFARDPDRLKQLGWRQFEEFLDAVFRNQGFHTQIGPGSGDGGIDHRLYQSEAIPEIVAVVQAKRYTDTPIGLEAVAALLGVAAVEGAPNAIFATTSRYLPGAREYAQNARQKLHLPNLDLADLGRIQEWCGTIAQQLETYFGGGELSLPPLLTNRSPSPLSGQVVVASWGSGVTLNSFAVIEADYPHEVILRSIGHRDVSGDGQRGTQMPDEGGARFQLDPIRFVAFRSESGGREHFWGNGRLYSLWDGTPQYFDSCD